MNKYLNEFEAAEETGYAVQTFRNWRHEGRGPEYLKIGRTIRYSREKLLAWMDSHRVKTADSGRSEA